MYASIIYAVSKLTFVRQKLFLISFVGHRSFNLMVPADILILSNTADTTHKKESHIATALTKAKSTLRHFRQKAVPPALLCLDLNIHSLIITLQLTIKIWYLSWTVTPL